MSNARISLNPVKKIAQEKGIDNPYALSLKAGISYNTTKRYWYDDQTLACLDKRVLIALAVALECRPGDLIDTTEGD